MVILKPKKIVNVELSSTEIELIIEELNRSPHNLYEYFNYSELIDKLKKGILSKNIDAQEVIDTCEGE